MAVVKDVAACYGGGEGCGSLLWWARWDSRSRLVGVSVQTENPFEPWQIVAPRRSRSSYASITRHYCPRVHVHLLWRWIRRHHLLNCRLYCQRSRSGIVLLLNRPRGDRCPARDVRICPDSSKTRRLRGFRVCFDVRICPEAVVMSGLLLLLLLGDPRRPHRPAEFRTSGY